jgi:hypothetical protein
MSNLRSDIFITDHDGNPVAALEVKNRENLSREVATVLRRNLIVHGNAPAAPYFLLVSQDAGYLWKNAKPEDIDAPPDYQFPLNTVLARYLPSEPKRRLSGAELELVLLQWLIELTLEHPKSREEPERTLARAGFDDAIRGGRVVAEAVA